MKTITLRVWVSNQDAVGLDHDCTTSYIEHSGWTAPAGVTLDANAQTISGPAEDTYQAYRSLAEAVAELGHGLDSIEDEEEVGKPCLVACPIELIEDRWTCAAQSLAHIECQHRKTWAEFVAAIPSLAAEEE